MYGVALGSVFFGESMFSLVNNASKIAFAYLLQNSHYKLIDCQVENKHLQSFEDVCFLLDNLLIYNDYFAVDKQKQFLKHYSLKKT